MRAGGTRTAQAWNDVVNAIADLRGFVEATTGARVQVQVAGPSIETDSVRVSAIAADGGVTDAAAPVPPSDSFTLSDLLGFYTIRAEARGFTAATAAVAIPAEAPVSLTLTRSAPAMPAVFGLTLEQALAALRTAAIVPARVVDITGRDVPPANPGAEFNSTLVLVQLPPPGYPVAADSGAQLVRVRRPRSRGDDRDALACRSHPGRGAARARSARIGARQRADPQRPAVVTAGSFGGVTCRTDPF